MRQNNPDMIHKNDAQIRQDAKKRVISNGAHAASVILIGMATCGIAAGALDIKKAFEESLADRKVDARVVSAGCIGHCYAEPVVIVKRLDSPPRIYQKVTPGIARMIVKYDLEGGQPLIDHLLDITLKPLTFKNRQPPHEQQNRIVLDLCGTIDPGSIHDYIDCGGYAALKQVLQRQPEDIILEITKAGLRGRGGAGFKTGLKWNAARGVSGTIKYAICNADEGDPGTYMDRTLLESNPHQILEGLAICCYAVGAQKAAVYLRAEYPLAVNRLTRAIEQAARVGLLGKDILGSGFNLEVEIFKGSGAFVCGEETALIRSMEGKRGMPEFRPPFPVESGFMNQPTVINNVKTLATIPSIIQHGARWFRKIGTKNSPGTAIFSVVGDVLRPGLVEIPMGVTLRTLIFDICGGVPGRKKFKAVQIGGPSGGCIPADHLDTPIEFDSLEAAGAMMGSGGMVVMDENSCMVDVARYFLEFTQKESCGKCTFCRIGTKQMLDMLNRITKGEGSDQDLEQLEAMSMDIKNGSLCALGKTAPNPVLTTLRYFRDEYEAHIREKRCPAGRCRPLTAFYIDLSRCMRGCEACVGSCPTKAIFTTQTRKKGIDQALCIKCGECVVTCPMEYEAIKKISPPELAPIIERPT